jgi:hypothetical protein
MYEREKSRSAKKSAKNRGALNKSAKNQGARERESANAKARNLRPKKSAKSSAQERESASVKKSACTALKIRTSNIGLKMVESDIRYLTSESLKKCLGQDEVLVV